MYIINSVPGDESSETTYNWHCAFVPSTVRCLIINHCSDSTEGYDFYDNET